jgi:hypothetical protein
MSRSKRSSLLAIGLTALALLIGGLLFARAEAPRWLRQKLIRSVKSSCAGCGFKIGKIELGLSQGRASVRDFLYEDAPGGHARVKVKADRIDLKVNPKAFLKSLRKGTWMVQSVHADRIEVTVTEDPKIHSGPDEGAPPFSGIPAIVFKKIAVKDGTFHYVNKVDPKPSSLLLTQIDGETGPWATRRELAKAYAAGLTPIHATGVLEHTGQFLLQAHADPLSAKGTALISLEVKKQPLEAVSPFFYREEGIKLEGFVVDIATRLKMVEGRISGDLNASYKDLKIKVDEKNHGGLRNWIVTLGANLITESDEGVDGNAPGKEPVHGVRAADQSLISAIFKSLGESVKQLVKKSS